MEVGGWNGVGCFLHALHLVVTNSLKSQAAVLKMLAKIRNVVRTLRHSTKAKTVLSKAQEREELPQHSLIIDQETRWSSTYYMLERFYEQKRAIMLACLDLDKIKLRLLDSNEWAILPALIHLLKIFADVVNFCEREDSCISEAIPNAKSLLFNLERAERSGLSSFKEELKSNMRKYFYGADARRHFTCIEENLLYAVATFLDPRFRKKAFISLQAADQAENMLVHLPCSKVGEVSTRKIKG